MVKCGKQFMVLLAAVALSSLPALSAETWYIERGSDWKLLSPASRKAFSKAEKLHRKGKLVDAVRTYDKFLAGCDPNSGLYGLALERQFSIAEELLAGRKIKVLGVFKIKGYAYGTKIMDNISGRAGLEDPNGIGIRAARAVAQNYEKKAKSDKAYYQLAHLKWLEIFEVADARLPGSPPTERDRVNETLKQALLGMARCKNLEYKGAEYDACALAGRTVSTKRAYDNAKRCYEEFRVRYPDDAVKLNIDEKLRQIDEDLAYKDLTTGRYYQKNGHRQAANLYYQMVISDWPRTEAEKLARQMLQENLSANNVNETNE